MRRFDAVLKAEEAPVIQTAIRAPNAYAERFVQTGKQACLRHFLICRETQPRRLLAEFITHDHREKCQQGPDNRPPLGVQPGAAPGSVALGPKVGTARLGGLRKHYRRAAWSRPAEE